MNTAILRATLVALVLVLVAQLMTRWRHVRQNTPQAKAKRSSPGRTCRPECPACEAEGHEPAPPPRPAAREKRKAGRPRSVNTDWHFCPNRCCSHYGWVGLGNIVANGHPNGGRWRQLHCTVCSAYFMETTGTIFFRSPLLPETLCRIVQGLAEGWNLHSIARVFEVDPNTVKACLIRAAEHMDAVSNYLIHNLHLTQVQVDELWALVQSWGDEDEEPSARKQRRQGWVWAGIDPITKLLLATVVGGRILMYAQLLIHAIAVVLAPGVVPLFLSDQLRHYTTAILTHFGHWVEVPRRSKYGPAPKDRWEPLPELNYAQVVKRRVKGRVVEVTQRVVFGCAETITVILSGAGHKINTAFIKRVNLTLRAHIPALGRKVLSFAKTITGLAQQVSVARTYYNFCLPHRSLRLPLPEPIPTKGNGSLKRWMPRTPAMAAGITSRVWTMEECLLFRVPPWRQEVTG
jgi:IS1 family transposase/transposase-like protein